MANARFIPSLESARGLAALSVCLFHAAELPFQDGGRRRQEHRGRHFAERTRLGCLVFCAERFCSALLTAKAARCKHLRIVRGLSACQILRLMPTIVATVLVFVCVAWVVEGREPQLGEIVRNALLIDIDLSSAFWTLHNRTMDRPSCLLRFCWNGDLACQRYSRCWQPSCHCRSPVVVLHRPDLARLLLHLHAGIFGCGAAATNPTGSGPSRHCWALVAGLFCRKRQRLCIQAMVAARDRAQLDRDRLALSSEHYRGWLQWPPVRFLGTVSYSFYALHPLGLQVDRALRAPLEGSAGRPGSASP